MNLTDFSTLVSLLVALSVAAERLVEIVKGFSTFLNQENPNPRMEGIRKSLLQLLAVVSGIVTVFLTQPVIGKVGTDAQGSLVPQLLDSWLGLLALGLLTSGGSGFWNSLQTYVNKAKDVKKLEAEQKKIETTTSRASQAGTSAPLSADTRTGNP
jgi:hypothetical protein